ncbi:CASC3/Barentsz eIF4AIII binding-domain-containing protein [Podospora didyma]|uniref:CASC3/Barentsz eIF4AIII binding-domain-containing protein n=1 Tax=Podospora didyma TaxID=330526 RepID=A0AAE0KJG6_9PEZI|nr:CASC3/Barentsz eIF4AIII binding-domain-containing protein [Podospora didyma]
MAAAAPRRRKIIGHRRRVEDEGEEEGGPEALDLDDDSMTDGSVASGENDAADDSDTSNVDEASPTSPNAPKSLGNGAAKPGFRRQPADPAATKKSQPVVAEAETMLTRLSLADKDDTAQEINFVDVEQEQPPATETTPVIVGSSTSRQQSRLPPQEVKRREHEEYRRKRDEDPTFVPNRGAFFLHDHRHAGPAANGFRPFPRGARGGRGRGAFGGGPFAPINQLHHVSDPTTNGQWHHDMHEVVTEPMPHHRPARHLPDREGPPNGNGVIHTAAGSKTTIDRNMSAEKQLGTITVRVYIPSLMGAPKSFPNMPLRQYTKLPDHRPPLRRDKPVRISIPHHSPPIMPRYIFPATDRSFIFIPRAMRPNQQRVRGKGLRSSVLGSIGGFSRRTSVFGGSIFGSSMYGGSTYSPSIAMSRRSSIAPEIGRELLLSPTGSTFSRPPLPADNARPIVRLPPPVIQPRVMVPPMPMPMVSQSQFQDAAERAAAESSINDFPQPQTHPLPQKPTFQENQPVNIPMHQPRPQKTVSVENIESPVQQQQAMNTPAPYQQPFHQQVPPQVSNGYVQDSHARHLSYPSRISTGTPLSQIPERAIHAAPFQPNTYPQPGFYNQPYPMLQAQPQQGFYYPPPFAANIAPNASAPAFVPGGQQGQPMSYNPSGQGEVLGNQTNTQTVSSQGLVAQEMNGMVYYYDPAQLPAMAGFPPYPAAQPYATGMVNVGGMMSPSPDTFYYQQPAQPMVYYSQ